ncbi:UNVERIFIED_CONTAM: tRNA (adenine22-N1)-methyltransferase [Acetivibrio alkalicellulosi]
MELTGRLKLIADMTPKCNIVSDIGTDHAYIPIFLVKNNICTKAIASDVRIGPVNVATKNIEEYRVSDKVITRIGSGLESILDNEIDVVIIAGMGGMLIKELLEKSLDKVKKANALILQPMYAIEVVHEWLCENGFEVYDEALAKEDHKIYNVIACKWAGCNQKKDEIYYHIGEKLFEKRDPLLKKHLQNKIDQLDKIINQMENMKEKESIKKAEYLKLKKNLYNALNCL